MSGVDWRLHCCDHEHPQCPIVISPSCECIARVGNLGGPAVRFWRRWWQDSALVFSFFLVVFFLVFFCVFSHILLFSFFGVVFQSFAMPLSIVFCLPVKEAFIIVDIVAQLISFRFSFISFLSIYYWVTTCV